jgi:myo-inositol 2-dehydrogenase/D-chiro-inositol 1-dehydrogenase
MRRFDPGYNEMRNLLIGGTYGEALAFHCIHRNASVPPYFDSATALVSSCGHEVDISRYVLSAELTSVKVFKAKRSRHANFDDPMLVVFETDKGQLVDVELFLNAQYGYDVKGELICETGTMSFGPAINTEIRSNGVTATGLAPDWRPRFAAAYRIQNQAWVDSIRSGVPVGSSAWDGYVATTVTDAGVRSLTTGETVAITYEKRPALYA